MDVLPSAPPSVLRLRFVRTAFVGLAVALALCGPLHGQQPSFGPLSYEEGSPLQRLAYTPSIEGADVVGRGVWGIDVYNGFSNIFEQDSTATHVLFLDMERLSTALTVRWGATETLEAGARLALETTGAGALDDFIVGWHDRLGFGNANRDRFPSDEYRQSLTDGNGSVFLEKPAQTFGVRDLRAFAKWRAWRSLDGRSVVSLRTVMRIPSVGPRQGNGGLDGAAMALWQAGMGSWYLHGLAGLALTRRSPELEPVLRSHSTFVAVGVERSLGSRVAALAQFQMQSAALRSFDHRELDRAPTNLLLGLAGRVGDAWTWDASFQEDIPADTPAVDFTLTLRVGRRW